MKWYVAAAMALSLLFSASAELFYYVGNGGTDLRETDSYKLGSRDGNAPGRLPGAGDVIIFGSRYSSTTNQIEIAAEDIDFIASVAAISLRIACDLTVNVETNTHLPCAIGYFDETNPTWEWKGRDASVTYRVSPGVDLHLDSYRQLVASKAPIDYCTREMTVTGGGRVILCDSLPQSTDSSGFLGILTIDEGSSFVLGAGFKGFNIDGLEGGGTFTTLRTSADGGVIAINNNNNRPHDFSGFLNLPCQIFRLNSGVTQNLLGPTNMLYSTSSFFQASGSVLGFGVGNAKRATPSSVGTNIVVYFKEGHTNTIRYAGTDPATAVWGKQIYFYNAESIIDAGRGPFQLGAANGTSDGYLWRSVRSTSSSTAKKGAARLVLTGEGTVTNTWRFGVYNKDANLLSDLPVALVKKGTCTWKDIFKSPNNLTGVYAVDEGTLQFDTFAPAGEECSLGYGNLLYDPDYSSIAMPIDETKRVGYQLRIGGGESAGTLEYIGTADVVNDSRVIAVNGEGTLKNSSVKSFRQYGIVTAGAGDHRLTLDGIAEAGDITNEVGTLSIAKKGANTTHLVRALRPNGMLEVEEGRLVVGRKPNPTFTYFKLIIKENMSHCFCADKGQGGYGGFEAAARFDELSFYDADGVRHGLNVLSSDVATVLDLGANECKVVVGSVSTSYGLLENIFDGEFVSATQGATSSSGVVSPRNSSSSGGGTMENPKPPSTEKGYYHGEPSSWSEFVVRLPLDTPEIKSFDFVMMAGTNQSWHVAVPRVFELQGSSDGVIWHTLYTMDDLNAYFIGKNLPFVGVGLWASTGISTATDAATAVRKLDDGKGFGFVRRAYDEATAQDFSQVTGVKVAPGAELALDGFTAADAIDLIVIDSAVAGMGKLEHATLAATGTLELGEIPAEGSFDIPADLSGVANPAALAGWQVKLGAQVKSKWSARATATGIHVSKPGTMVTFR